MASRTASHAGSWYTADPVELSAQLAGWLAAVDVSCGAARAIIAPHAGYSYSGSTAACAFRHIQPTKVRRIFLLGPSHHMYSPKCLLSECSEYATPLGSVSIDHGVYNELMATSLDS